MRLVGAALAKTRQDNAPLSLESRFILSNRPFEPSYGSGQGPNHCRPARDNLGIASNIVVQILGRAAWILELQ